MRIGRRSLRRTARRAPGDATAAGVRPRRSLGQNFLVQPGIADRIVECLELEPGDEVVEIGPGLGILSERLARHRLRRFTLVELDATLAARLRAAFAGHPAVRVLSADFLRVDLATLVERAPVKVVGNLPFNVAGAILRRLAEVRRLVSRMVLMFQREVAERIRALPGEKSYSALSVFSAFYWEVEGHFRVGARNFRPVPKVDAEVMTLVPMREPPCASHEEPALLATVRAAFSTPRKTVRNALKTALGLDRESVEAALLRAAIEPRLRAEDLALADFVRLARVLGPYFSVAGAAPDGDA